MNKLKSAQAYAAWKALQNGLPEVAEDELAAMHGMQNFRIRHNGKLLAKMVLPVILSLEDIERLQEHVEFIMKTLDPNRKRSAPAIGTSEAP